MARKIKRVISVNEKDFSVRDVIEKLDKGDQVPLEYQVAALVKLQRTTAKFAQELKELEIFEDELKNRITTKKYSDHIEGLYSSGKIYSKEEKPIIEITNKDGSVYSVTLSEGVDDNFCINPSLSSKSVLDSLEEKYKKVSVSLDKKVIRSEFEAGTLPASLSMFVSKEPIDITKLRISCTTEPTKTEEAEDKK